MKVEDDELNKKALPWRVIPALSGGISKYGESRFRLSYWYFGEMISLEGIVQNIGGYYDADATIVANFQFKNGIVDSGEWCYVADKVENEVCIVGNQGKIVYDGLSAKNCSIIRDDKKELFEFGEPPHVAMPYEQAIVGELTKKKKKPCFF